MSGVDPNARAGFEQLFRDTRSDLLAYIMRRSQSAEDAADVLAETYLIAWQKLEAIPRGERARLWLFGVARNVLLRGVSQRRSGDLLVERLAGELRAARLPQAPLDDERSDLWTALAALAEPDRELLALAAWEGLTPKQIATVLGRSPNLIRVRLHRARTRLKRQLDITHAEGSIARRDAPRKRLSRRRDPQRLEGNNARGGQLGGHGRTGEHATIRCEPGASDSVRLR